MQGVLSEFMFALRSMARRPGFFALATVTLALGIGVNGALFSLLDAIYFRPLPFSEPDRLFRIESTSPKAFLGLLSHREYEEIRNGTSVFEDVLEVGSRGVLLHQGAETRMLRIDYVSPSFFEATGIGLHRGRGFEATDTATPQVIVNHHLWQEHLSSRIDVLGSAIQLNDTLFTIVGVTPPRFVGLDRIVRTDVWVMTSQAPLVVPRLSAELANPYHRWFEVYVRLAPGAGVESARAQLDTMARRWQQEAPLEYPESGLKLTALSMERRDAIRQGAVLLALPALVLLMACANVTNLILARSDERRRELAIRTAVGAGRGRLARLLTVESLVLAVFGTILGILVASWVIDLFPALVPPAAITYALDTRMDARAFAFALVLMVISALLVALAPAVRSGRVDVVAGLKGEATSFRSARARTQYVIVAFQVAVGVMVLVGAALVLRSLSYSVTLDPGFDGARSVATIHVVPALRGHSADATHRFLEESRRRLSSLPSVRRVSYGIRLPAQGNEAGWARDFVVPGVEPPPGQEAFRVRYTMVGPDYFEVMGTGILAGRGIDETDRADSEDVAVISATMADRLYAAEDPIGKTLLAGADRRPTRIVGVAEDIAISNLYGDAEMYVYVPFSQDPQGFGVLLVHAENAEAIGPLLKAELARIDPDLPVLETSTMTRHMRLVLFEEYRDAAVAAGVAVLALLLTSVGIYAVITVATGARTREIGIRMALGARRDDVLGLVLGRGLALASAGAAAGVVAAMGTAWLLESRLHGVAPRDPLAFVAGTGLVLALALGAALLPAIRASRLDPSRTLRGA